MRIRNYEAKDASAIALLFYETVHAINRADYSPEQVRAWAPEVFDPAVWHARLSSRCTLVAEEDDEVVALAALEGDGHLDLLYCRKDFIGRGVGSRLYRAVEQKAREWELERIFTEASITSRPFFERRGFRVVREQPVVRRGVELTNFAMEKPLRTNEDVDRRTPLK